ncbi:MAG: glucosaminidase domain-containing protein [Propionibacteriaceae bacterium]|jgi:flagellum-specific peptidoglycan hydrolase FlgJ|nr:glucosaminidase domain-containing protein [Propionibacteriaceae bacterium]
MKRFPQALLGLVLMIGIAMPVTALTSDADPASGSPTVSADSSGSPAPIDAATSAAAPTEQPSSSDSMAPTTPAEASPSSSVSAIPPASTPSTTAPTSDPSDATTPDDQAPATPDSTAEASPSADPTDEPTGDNPFVMADDSWGSSWRASEATGQLAEAPNPRSRSARAVAVTGPGTLDNSRTGKFIQSLAYPAHLSQQRYGVPASVTLAQAILESGWGESTLTRFGQAYFGIKCTTQMSQFQSGCVNMSTWEVVGGNQVNTTAGFRTYASVTDSLMDHAYLLRSLPRYAAAFATSTPDDFARAIKAGGYATDPLYADKLINLMNSYNLRAYDSYDQQIIITVEGGIGQLYWAMGGLNSALGYPVGAEVASAVPGVTLRNFDHGAIIWSSSNGAHALTGAIWDAYRGSRSLRQQLGAAWGDATAACGGGVMDFAGGLLSAKPGSYILVSGVNRVLYRNAGGTNSPWGCPTDSEGHKSDGYYQSFDNHRVFWTDIIGAHSVYRWGDIGWKYYYTGSATGPYGYPTSEETAIPGGSRQDFQNYHVYWSAATGAHTVYRHGDIGWKYWQNGSTSSRLGFPTSDETATASGAYQDFEHGRISWTPAGGAVISYR